MKSPYKSIAVQSIGWADVIISEGAVDPNNYQMHPHDPYNTDDEVFEDLFDQWLRSKSGRAAISRCDWSDECKETLQLAFELGCQLAMTNSKIGAMEYHRSKEDTLTEFGVDLSIDYGHAPKAAFDAGFHTILSSAKQ